MDNKEAIFIDSYSEDDNIAQLRLDLHAERGCTFIDEMREASTLTNFDYYCESPEMVSLFMMPTGRAFKEFESWLYQRTKENISNSSDDNYMLSEYYLQWLKESHRNMFGE